MNTIFLFLNKVLCYGIFFQFQNYNNKTTPSINSAGDRACYLTFDLSDSWPNFHWSSCRLPYPSPPHPQSQDTKSKILTTLHVCNVYMQFGNMSTKFGAFLRNLKNIMLSCPGTSAYAHGDLQTTVASSLEKPSSHTVPHTHS